MSYVITDGINYVRKNFNGKYVTIRNAAMADEFTKQIAEKILQNSLSKRIRKGLYIQKVDDGKKKELPEIDIHKEICFDLPDDIQEWILKLQNLNGLTQEAQNKKNVLKQSLIDIEKQINDLAHYVEFCSLNACQGYKVSKKWHDLRCERRQIKNELDVLNVILNHNAIDSITNDIEKVILNINDRKYKPRELTELFDV